MTMKLLMLVIFFAIMVSVGIYARKHATSVDGYGICVWYVILLCGCICRICRSVRMEIRSCVDMDRNRKCDHRKSAGMGGTWKTYQGNDTASEFQDDAGFLW